MNELTEEEMPQIEAAQWGTMWGLEKMDDDGTFKIVKDTAGKVQVFGTRAEAEAKLVKVMTAHPDRTLQVDKVLDRFQWKGSMAGSRGQPERVSSM